MSNDVQSHEDVAERVAGEERRASARHAARSLGSVTARIIGGSQVELVNFSNRGVLFECDSRLLIGARASVRITTTDANLIVTGRVVRSRVKGLVNGALRYDAALVLDTELGLVPTILDALPAAMDDSAEVDDMVAFESELDATFDPSPVEAYLAESEASLLEADLPLHVTAGAAPAVADAEGAFEPPPLPPLASAPLESDDIEAPGVDTSAEYEPIAFEADAEIAFEPAVEFAFDDIGEPSFEDAAPLGDTSEGGGVLASEAVEPVPMSADTSMFDATYTPPAAAELDAESQFDVRAARPVFEGTSSSFFDARPSENYGGEAPPDAELALETDDAVMTAPVLPDDPIDQPAAVADTEDRVLLQFAATVPHDLAELRRIAADNQW